MDVYALLFDLECKSGTTHLVVWPQENGDGQWCHNAHPDRSVMETRRGDTLIHKRRTHFRVKQVKVYRSSLALDESQCSWCESVEAAIADAHRR